MIKSALFYKSSVILKNVNVAIGTDETRDRYSFVDFVSHLLRKVL